MSAKEELKLPLNKFVLDKVQGFETNFQSVPKWMSSELLKLFGSLEVNPCSEAPFLSKRVRCLSRYLKDTMVKKIIKSRKTSEMSKSINSVMGFRISTPHMCLVHKKYNEKHFVASLGKTPCWTFIFKSVDKNVCDKSTNINLILQYWKNMNNMTTGTWTPNGQTHTEKKHANALISLKYWEAKFNIQPLPNAPSYSVIFWDLKNNKQNTKTFKNEQNKNNCGSRDI